MTASPKVRYPDGPRGLPLVGSLPALKRDPLKFLTGLAETYGDFASFRIGRKKRVIQFTRPEDIREILVVQHKSFRKTGLILQTKPILGNGLLTSEGDFHQQQRRLVQPALTRQHVVNYAGMITEFAVRLSQKWTDGARLDIFSQMLNATLGIATREFFGYDSDADVTRFESELSTAIEYFDALLMPSLGWFSKLPTRRNRRYKRAEKYLDDFVYRLIAERRKSPRDRIDVLSMLLRARDTEGDGRGMTDQQVRDEAMTLLTAGHETTATALTWTWHLLAHNPDVEKQLHHELDTVLGGRVPGADDVERLPYTRMVFAESMRLYPPLWALSRKAIEDCQIGDCHVPAGTTVGISQFVTHRDPRNYKDPLKFDPLRWTPEAAAARHKFSYFPFGGGPRICIGEPLAWLEGILFIATIAQQWQFRQDPGFVARIKPLITLRPKNGMPMRLERRVTRSERSAALQSSNC